MKTLYLIGTVLVAFMMVSCGKDSGNPVDQGPAEKFGSMVVTVADEHDNPFEGIAVDLESGNGQVIPYVFSDADGIARFDSVPEGQYTIRSSNNWGGYPLAEEAPKIDHCMPGVQVSGNDTLHVTLYYPLGPADLVVKAQMVSEINSNYDDIKLFLIDFPDTVNLDGQGEGILEGITLQNHLTLSANVSRHEMKGDAELSLATDSNGWPYFIALISYDPVMEIVSPQNDANFAFGRVLFTGSGYDYEEGELPGDDFQWRSNIDGVLGTGREIVADLSIGQHLIMLSGKDSEDNSSSASIVVNISHFSEESYFPLPQEGVWKYLHDKTDLAMTNDKGEMEYWTLGDMIVSSDNVNSRICRIEWTIDCAGEQVTCEYELTDHFAIDGNRFLVTGTDELLTVYKGDEPIEELAVEIAYAPFYPFLADHLDPFAQSEDVISVTATSSIHYTIFGTGTHTRFESGTHTISYHTGSAENITTSAGSYTVVPVYSTFDDIERACWFSRGTGIVSMEYNLFGETLHAELYETNMSHFTEISSVQKRPPTVRLSFSTPMKIDCADAEGRLREMCALMKSICPR